VTCLQEIARDCLRVDKLRLFGDYLCGVEPPLLTYNIDTHRYMAVAPETDSSLGGDTEHTPELDRSKVTTCQFSVPLICPLSFCTL